MVSIKEVAKKAGVSISTVSHSIRGTKYVSEPLKEKVLEAISELGYEVNSIASSLKSKKTFAIGIIVPNINRIFFPQVIKGMQERFADLGYNLIFFDSDNSLDKEKHFIGMLKNSWADGIIVDSVADPDDRVYLEFLQQLGGRGKKIPVISLERKFENTTLDCVRVDNYLAAKKAAEHLIECGCRKIVHIHGPDYSCMARERCDGFREEIAKCPGIQYQTIKGDFSPLSGYSAMKELLEKTLDIDGVFAANDQMAIGAIKALKEKNIRIPEDVKIIGFDNTFVASLTKPNLSTINVPKFEMGVAAADLLLKRIKNKKSPPQDVVLPTSLVKRMSTCGSNNSGVELFGW